MPKLTKKSLPTSWATQILSLAGPSGRSFFALAESVEYNTAFADENPPSFYSPTDQYTFVIHYVDGKKQAVFRVKGALLEPWWSPQGKCYAVGLPRGIFEIDVGGVSDAGIEPLPGTFDSIWGTGEDHVFACGSYDPFVLYRRYGKWQSLVLPPNPPDILYQVVGLHEQDVYVVGDEGTILHYDGSCLRLLEVPTTRDLRSIAPLGLGYLCIGGSQGILLQGNHAGWRLVPTGREEPIERLASFDGYVCYGTESGVFGFDGRSPPVRLIERPARYVLGVPGALVVVGDDEAWLYEEGEGCEGGGAIRRYRHQQLDTTI